ncbi:type II toxin-antitoxin system PemK/MazF family toxin [Crocosphaera sp. UHCC 0190]|uniref:type II toxin-antitoxin system PemK/MazF family toxin n=1 Tax=Crocosphaera sp. UHCC 0190 TaxID=3110246 RepID=UPI002B21FD69|nr:type II toxin-antitoxin system PemK/MazF family toxin [Crocosphaera sp. UHCC 0190]MEA5510274.1 type II toxin-antitoxin system PemK/MazF family toxin [Crocosphaera sp. UHCC 0190]
MKRGEIYYANLDPAMGSEMAKRRPVLIVSNDINNRAASTITILPLTSNVTRVYPFEVLIQPSESGLPVPSKVQAQQVRTISKERIQESAIGILSEAIMELVNAALRLHLDI